MSKVLTQEMFDELYLRAADVFNFHPVGMELYELLHKALMNSHGAKIDIGHRLTVEQEAELIRRVREAEKLINGKCPLTAAAEIRAAARMLTKERKVWTVPPATCNYTDRFTWPRGLTRSTVDGFDIRHTYWSFNGTDIDPGRKIDITDPEHPFLMEGE